MDEDLKQELLSILRELKNGTPEAFQALVDQRVTYLWARVWTHGLVGVLCVALVACCLWRLWKEGKRADWDVNAMNPATTILAFGAILVFGFASFTNLGIAACAIPDAIAPLGHILGMLR